VDVPVPVLLLQFEQVAELARVVHREVPVALSRPGLALCQMSFALVVAERKLEFNRD
jgi:hypothetical protein